VYKQDFGFGLPVVARSHQQFLRPGCVLLVVRASRKESLALARLSPSEGRQRAVRPTEQDGITLGFYCHVLPNMQADAAALVDGALQSRLNKPETKRQ
jgi:hypothetical protein